MLYNPKDPNDRKNAYRTFAEVMEGEELFELTRKGGRSLRQNSYLHLLLQYLASQLGVRMEYAKTEWYKKIVNSDIYCYQIWDPIKGAVTTCVRSSKDLSREEMKRSIERLKIWSAQTAEVVLPDAEDKKGIRHMQLEVDKVKNFI